MVCVVPVKGGDGDGTASAVGGLVLEGVHQVDEQGLVPRGIVEHGGGVPGGHGVDGLVVALPGVRVAEGCVDVSHTASHVCLIKKHISYSRLCCWHKFINYTCRPICNTVMNCKTYPLLYKTRIHVYSLKTCLPFKLCKVVV